METEFTTRYHITLNGEILFAAILGTDGVPCRWDMVGDNPVYPWLLPAGAQIRVGWIS